jgi:hypothetical protein
MNEESCLLRYNASIFRVEEKGNHKTIMKREGISDLLSFIGLHGVTSEET